MWVFAKLERCDFLGHCKYDKCQTLHDGSTYWASLIHTTFSDSDCISRLQQCQTVLIENSMFLSDYDQTLCDCWLRQVHHWYTTFSPCRCPRETNYTFSRLKKKVRFFFDTIKASSFKLCMIITLLGVYIVIVVLMTLSLFQSHRGVRNKNRKLSVWESCPV